MAKEVRVKYEISPAHMRPDPNNANWTIPRTWGVWDVGHGTGGKRYRYGNNPVRAKELQREFRKVRMVRLFKNRSAAKSLAESLNC